MALKIEEDCINCDVCESVCPHKAIAEGPLIYIIDPMLCQECQGDFDEPQCVVYCPVACIVKDPDHPEA